MMLYLFNALIGTQLPFCFSIPAPTKEEAIYHATAKVNRLKIEQNASGAKILDVLPSTESSLTQQYQEAFFDTYVTINWVKENHRLIVTVDHDELSFHTLFTGITDDTVKSALTKLFQLINFDIEKVRELQRLGLFNEMLSRYQLDDMKKNC